jgi:phosphoribosylanthranilate isomerase
MKSKICGISDFETLKFLTNHPNPPQYIGFIVNYPKSKRFVQNDTLRKILTIDKRKSKYVAVLVKPDKKILERIKDLPFDYYQIYDSSANDVSAIKKKYKKKIIVAITVNTQKDVLKHKEYKEIADIFLFDSKGYEKSLSFDHHLIKDLELNQALMLAGNIKLEDTLEKYKEIADIIDISGDLETSGLKDISKIDIFLNKIKQINDKA